MKEAPALDTNLDGEINVKAGKATDDDIKAYYEATTGELANATDLGDFAKKPASLQDAAVAATLAEYKETAADAKKAAAPGMTDLLSTIDSRVEAVVAKNNAILDTSKTLEGKAAELKALDNDITLSDDEVKLDSTVIAKADKNGNLVLEKAPTEATPEEVKAFTDAQALAADYIAAYNANNAAEKALESAKEALVKAVHNVVLKENDAYSVVEGSDTGLINLSDFNGKDKITAEEVAGTIDLEAPVDIYKTKADADKVVVITPGVEAKPATAATYEIDLNGVEFAVGQTIAGLTTEPLVITVENIEDVAGALAAAGAPDDWEVKNVGDVLTYTAETDGASTEALVPEVTAADAETAPIITVGDANPAGVAAVKTKFDITLPDDDWTAGQKVTFGDIEVTVEGEELTAADVATQVVAAAAAEESNSIWDVTAVGGVLTFEAKEGGVLDVIEVPEVTPAAGVETVPTITVGDANPAGAAAVKTKFTIDLAADNTNDWVAGQTVTFGDVEVTVEGADPTAASVAAQVVAAEASNSIWDVTADGGVLTFEAKEGGVLDVIEVPEVTPAPVAKEPELSGTFTPGVDAAEGTEPEVTEGESTALESAAPKAEALAEANEKLADFEKLVAQFEEARDLNTEMESLNNAVTEAREAITNPVDDEDAPGLGITLLEGDDTDFTAGDDVYLFNPESEVDISLDGFGAEGLDNIFFGTGFSLVEITGDVGITGNHGDVNALEIFWEQDGDNVNLYVEAEAFAGNGSGTADLTKVTLVGVDAADIQDNLDNGFLTAGEVIA